MNDLLQGYTTGQIAEDFIRVALPDDEGFHAFAYEPLSQFINDIRRDRLTPKTIAAKAIALRHGYFTHKLAEQKLRHYATQYAEGSEKAYELILEGLQQKLQEHHDDTLSIKQIKIWALELAERHFQKF